CSSDLRIGWGICRRGQVSAEQKTYQQNSGSISRRTRISTEEWKYRQKNINTADELKYLQNTKKGWSNNIWITLFQFYYRLLTASISRLTPSSNVSRGQAMFIRINSSPSSP